MDATRASIRATQSDASRTVLQHCHDVQFYSAMFTRLIVDPRLMSIAQSIIGPNVQLHHTKLFVKPPERGSHWHAYSRSDRLEFLPVLLGDLGFGAMILETQVLPLLAVWLALREYWRE